MDSASLSRHLKAQAEEFSIPGAAAGVLVNGEETYASFGVTNIEAPVEVNEDTLFHLGSLTKTFTATALMRLVDRGDVALESPIRTYVPEFRVQDEDAAAKVTVLQILNHTAGWQELRAITGEGDDALARYVEEMAGLEQVTPPGTRASYNNPAYCLAARILEVVTETSYEQAMHDLLFAPLDMTRSFFSASEAIMHRVCVGHSVADDGTVIMTPQWTGPRAWNAFGGLTSTVADQLRWARFHLSDGGSLMGTETLHAMQRPTVELLGMDLGDAVGIGWMLREIDGVHAKSPEGGRTDRPGGKLRPTEEGGVWAIGHDGWYADQYSAFLMAPSRNFAAVVLANASPGGLVLTRTVLRQAMADAIGIHLREPGVLPLTDAQARAYAGVYENAGAWVRISAEGGTLHMAFEIKPEMAALIPGGAPTYKPWRLALLHSEQFVVLDGPFAHQRGVFRREDGDDVAGVEYVGRYHQRSAA